MTRLATLTLTAAIMFAVTSCCREGDGGDATLVVFLKHHGTTVKNHVTYPDTVYVKFNAKDAPKSLGDYDTKFAGEPGEDHVHVEGLKCGDYYIYGAGFDSTINTRVIGGMHVKIKHKERKDEIDTDLAVSE
jgi:hypothetical protein